MAFTNICILKYNNYFNRKVMKAGDVLTDYPLDYSYIQNNYNFAKGDGIDTTAVLNNYNGAFIELGGCDYALEFNDNNEILSRWFIIERKQTRAGQSEFTLHRDVIADNLAELLEAPIFIEKGTVTGPEDVAIYNQEPEQMFNQIKQKETLLHDWSDVPWIVGYFATDATFTEQTLTPLKIDTYGEYDNINDFRVNLGIDNQDHYNLMYDSDISVEFHLQPAFIANDCAKVNLKEGSVDLGNDDHYTSNLSLQQVPSGNKRTPYLKEIVGVLNRNYDTLVADVVTNTYNTTKPDFIGKIVKIGSKYYKVSDSRRNTSKETEHADSDAIVQHVYNFINSAGYPIRWRSYQYKAVKSVIKYIEYDIILTEIKVDSFKVAIPQTVNTLNDAPYKMFAIPAGDIELIRSGSGTGLDLYTLGKDEVLNIVMKMVPHFTNEKLYDIQLLPYCPCQNLLGDTGSNELHITGLTEHYDYEFVKDSNNDIVDVILFPKNSTFSFNIELDNSEVLELPESVTERKVVGQCDKWRLCGPNYNSVFEFNLLKTGDITTLNVDCTYKPFSPYIHVNPVWSRLYGEDFDDTRGLICGGDFSLPRTTDAWEEYKLQNKNYQQIFDRQIESVELQNKYARIQDMANAATGAVKSFAAGSVLGGPIAGAASFVGGAALGAIDNNINEKLRQDTLDQQKDLFTYNLQNVQALPNTLNRVSSFDANNKIYPVLEYYSCTDSEKEIFRNSMRWSGMTINRIDKLLNFITGDEAFIKGKIIRMDALSDDYHMATTIYNELSTGLYFDSEVIN